MEAFFLLQDVLNAAFVLGIVNLLCNEKLNKKEKFLLFIHIPLCFILNGFFIDPSYMPDQFRYLDAAQAIRDGNLNFFLSESLTVASAGLLFSLIPIPFIISLKSISLINTLFYILFYIKFVRNSQSKYKIFYLLYPSLVLYSCLALRDIIIMIGMYIFISSDLFRPAAYKIKMLVSIAILAVLKFQNALLLGIFWLVYKALKNSGWKRVVSLLIIASAAFLGYQYMGIEQIEIYRRAMYIEDGGIDLMIPDLTLPGFFLDALYFIVKPLPYEAGNALQLMQSIENIVVTYMLIKALLKQIKRKVFYRPEILSLNIFFISAMLLYGMVVFNFGSAARYRFSFIIIYLLLSELVVMHYSSVRMIYKKRKHKGLYLWSNPLVKVH